ncbi:hypothetical protein A3C09_03495 [Candidatus Uhrbacteria bacterium RIFCSPHIGHO2_02_FULL_47_44]|uniref:Uncharacterized protein n=1 Tax=Candidatus Uhrbacteria bacterium RIFCSPLOWO2_02_FULL_48_18 TaxID=1802408 RepID=A0A1F7V811_9BACT|nr:MAG: hypothetical protein A3C09_03495 [Candidatus Uhrbacteria bacterium RIFCSPHIGHO2_02_FULL_47_44]OGL76088.1 MAG: hypothetical protein A3E97_02325 [Candidatus Uhrbacteria bacterium RIFCSPHIGHO2_12_FULL_47_12]OGL80368.1 MAG: hypothetical protein A3B20_03035 [Candidatus Uhrbacteria bacterium RIFCSPLOWO2_01_FULL_47_17]OGL86227.1 MAG: hypothetical protein A3I41_01525 [Candidatus Uhrbacteria bacterium RIFCSPLOWO2_02_FULL_48_18]OGL93245.1 MAG: hypothetical protein A3H12_04810 [Candidatus Uhrbacte
MLKKILILSLVVMAGVSPFLPRVFADNASWKPLLAERVWNQTSFRNERLTFNANVSAPMKRNGIVFVSNLSAQCTNLGTCDKIDLSIIKDGKSQLIPAVDQQFLNPSFAMAQKGKFIFFTKSLSKDVWFDAFLVDPNTGNIHPFTSLARKHNELSFVSFSTSGDRLYTSLLQTNNTTKKVQSSLTGKSMDGSYEEREISFMLNAPWQQVMDAYNDRLLVKFQFSGGNKQLWMIEPASQKMAAIPNTWTEPQADILFAHFLTDGSVVFFQNYTLFTYRPGIDKEPVSHGAAKLSWNTNPNATVQIAGDAMSWVDVNRHLYVHTSSGVINLQMVKEGSVHLEKDAVYFADEKGTWKYTFASKKYESTPFLVTDVRETLRTGLDTKGNVWFENTTNQNLVKLGYGTNPVLSDVSHVIWKGTDGALYQATLATILSMQKSNNVFEGGFTPGTRVKAIGDSRVYMFGNDGQLHWIVSETVASTIFGTQWNKGIVEVPPTFLWRYANGVNVESDQAIKSL